MSKFIRQYGVFRIGQTYRAKSGEILDFWGVKKGQFSFRLRDPITLELTDKGITGAISKLSVFKSGLDLKKIDLKTYQPTGLIEKGSGINEDE